MIKNNLVVVLSKKEISLIAGGFNWKQELRNAGETLGEAQKKANTAIDQGAREFGSGFKEGQERAKREEEEKKRQEAARGADL